MARGERETFPCPNCYEDVPVGAKVCPHCGSDEQTGWSEDTMYDGMDLPVFAEEEEAGEPKPHGEGGWLYVAAVVLMLVAMVLFALFLW